MTTTHPVDRTPGLLAAIHYLGMAGAVDALDHPIPTIGRTPWITVPPKPGWPRLSRLLALILSLLTPRPLPPP